MVRTLIGIVLLMWILGFATQFGGNLIHTLLVIAAVLFLFDLFTGRGVSV